MITEVLGVLASPLERERLRTDLPFDRFTKSVLVWLTLALSAVLLGQNYFGVAISCRPPAEGSSEELMKFIDSFCWSNLHTVILEPNSTRNVTTSPMPHKFFPMLLLSQVAAVLIPIFLWEISAVPSLLTFLQSVIVFSNDLSEKLLEFYSTVSGQSTEQEKESHQAVIHLLSSDLKETLVYWLDRRASRILRFYIVRQWASSIVCCAYTAIFIIFVPYGKISRSEITCQDNIKKFHHCTITSAYTQAVVWVINIILLLILALICFIYGLKFLKASPVESSFFYRNIPGHHTAKFKQCVETNDKGERVNITALKLLSTFIYHNESFFERFAYTKRSAMRIYGKPVSGLQRKIKAQVDNFWNSVLEDVTPADVELGRGTVNSAFEQGSGMTSI